MRKIKQTILDWIVYHFVRSWYWYNVVNKNMMFRKEVMRIKKIEDSGDRPMVNVNSLIYKRRYKYLSKSFMRKQIKEIMGW